MHLYTRHCVDACTPVGVHFSFGPPLKHLTVQHTDVCVDTHQLAGFIAAASHLVWEAEGLRQLADLAQGAQVLVQAADGLLDVLTVGSLRRT